MTQTRAHRALSDFLQRAHIDGLTFVLVITGKGSAAAAHSGRGVLRRQVPQWLSLPEFRTLVVGFEEAHIGHGGEGALYVRIGGRGDEHQNGRTIPTRGSVAIIQPRTDVVRSAAGIGGTSQ